MDAMMEQAENDAYLSTLNDLKPTAPFSFGDPGEIKVRDSCGSKSLGSRANINHQGSIFGEYLCSGALEILLLSGG